MSSASMRKDSSGPRRLGRSKQRQGDAGRAPVEARLAEKALAASAVLPLWRSAPARGEFRPSLVRILLDPATRSHPGEEARPPREALRFAAALHSEATRVNALEPSRVRLVFFLDGPAPGRVIVRPRRPLAVVQDGALLELGESEVPGLAGIVGAVRNSPSVGGVYVSPRPEGAGAGSETRPELLHSELAAVAFLLEILAELQEGEPETVFVAVHFSGSLRAVASGLAEGTTRNRGRGMLTVLAPLEGRRHARRGE